MLTLKTWKEKVLDQEAESSSTSENPEFDKLNNKQSMESSSEIEDVQSEDENQIFKAKKL